MPSLKVVMPDEEPESTAETRAEELRLLEAMLFAAAEPLDEKSLAARLPQHLFGQIGAAAASAGATGRARQIVQIPDAFSRGPADHGFGNGIADADVHGSATRKLLDVI